jgi:hypothetical protein
MGVQKNLVEFDSKTGDFMVKIVEGKTVKVARQQYHLTTSVPPCWIQEIDRFLSSVPKKQVLLFPTRINTLVPKILKQANPSLDGCRSVRRGTAQTVAADPDVAEATVQKLTAHTNLKMLQRYLNWGKVRGKEHLLSLIAAKNLDPERKL